MKNVLYSSSRSPVKTNLCLTFLNKLFYTFRIFTKIIFKNKSPQPRNILNQKGFKEFVINDQEVLENIFFKKSAILDPKKFFENLCFKNLLFIIRKSLIIFLKFQDSSLEDIYLKKHNFLGKKSWKIFF